MKSPLVWKYLEETQEFLKNIKLEIEQQKTELTDGTVLKSQVLEREYSRGIGYIAGLQVLVDYIESIGEENEF